MAESPKCKKSKVSKSPTIDLSIVKTETLDEELISPQPKPKPKKQPNKKGNPKDYSDFFNFSQLVMDCLTEESSISFAQSMNLLPKKVKCPHCGDVLDKVLFEKTELNKTFNCLKQTCWYNVPITKNTWFDGIDFSVKKMLLLAYHFVLKSSLEFAAFETSGPFFDDEKTEIESVIDAYSICREIMLEALYQQSNSGIKGEKIGGPNLVVELGDAQFGKSKYDKGSIIDGQIMLGAICRDTKDFFFVPVEDTSVDGLMQVVQNHIEIGSKVQTDCFSICDRMKESGYEVSVIGRGPKNFDFESIPEVDLKINTIDSSCSWYVAKKKLTLHYKKHEFGSHFAEYLWHRKHQQDKCKFSEVLYFHFL